MDLEKINQKIFEDFKKGNFRENFNDLIRIYKYKKDSEVANKLGVVFIKLNKIKFAKFFFKISINEDRKNFKPYYNLANLLKSKDKKLSEEYVDQALSIERKKEALILKAHLLINSYKYEEVITILNNVKGSESFYLLGISYMSLGMEEESKFYFDESLKENNLYIDFLNLNTFPRVYNNTKNINYFRKKFENIYNYILTSLHKKKITNEDRINIINSKTNFLLSYQQKNDVELNKKYQNLCHKILNKTSLKTNFNVNKILFISGFFRRHTVSKLFFNFIEEMSCIDNLEVHILHLSDQEDDWTEMYKKLKINYSKSTNSRNIYNFLSKEKFGSIFFLDHAMNNISQSIINYKLAKNYFMFWGHPVTSGSTNVDFFISSELMDFNNENEYSEKLILLDGIGFNYKLDDKLKKLNISKIKENSIYIPQSLFKFLPKYDYLIGEILDQNQLSNISFIKDKDPYCTFKFINRLKKIPNIKNNFHRIIFLDGMDQATYYQELCNQKIVIDTIGWSGGNTTMEALYLNKPVITIKGKNLRSNHTSAILEQMDLNELIANDYSEFLSLIKKINSDQNFYNFIVSKIISNKNLIFNKNISLYKKIRNFL